MNTNNAKRRWQAELKGERPSLDWLITMISDSQSLVGEALHPRTFFCRGRTYWSRSKTRGISVLAVVVVLGMVVDLEAAAAPWTAGFNAARGHCATSFR